MKDRASKTALTNKISLSRSMLYYRHTQPLKDWQAKVQIEKVLRLPHCRSYGHKRIAQELNANKKKILRVMKIYGIKPYRRRRKPRERQNRENKSIYPNLLFDNQPDCPDHVWASDFTYLPFKGRFVYLATILDLFTREVVGFNVLTAHDVQLVAGALMQAVNFRRPPLILHSDQGSEYKSRMYTCLAENMGIQISMSDPGSPWENGYQESFYSHFKVDLGDPNRFVDLGRLVYAVYRTIYSYNHKRIHTSLKMPPAKYAQLFKGRIPSDVQFTV